jgi:hypothetical protein
LVLAGLGLIAGCQKTVSPDDTDRHRIEVMRTDPFLAGKPAGNVAEGRYLSKSFTPNSYRVTLTTGDRPAPDTAAQALRAFAKLGQSARGAGWTMIGARCRQPDLTIEHPSYYWELFGYRVRDGVPYGIHLIGDYSASTGLGTEVWLFAPFHTDERAYFQPAPTILNPTGNCVEGDADPDHPPNVTFDWPF